MDTDRRVVLLDGVRGRIFFDGQWVGVGTINIATLERAKQSFGAVNEVFIRLGETLRSAVRGWAEEFIAKLREERTAFELGWWQRFRRVGMVHVFDYDQGHVWSFYPKKRIIFQDAALPAQQHLRQERVNHVDRANWKRRRFNQQLRKKL